MGSLPTYSTLFACIHDEPEDYGSLGRGTHYSIMRCAEWFDVTRQPLTVAQVHDFAVVWDEDHDTRVIEAIERMYLAGLLAPVQFIGERKGGLTVIVASKFYFAADMEAYEREVMAIAQSLDDPWHTMVGMFDKAGARSGHRHQTDAQGLINDDEHRVNIYRSNIDSLWGLGTKPHSWPQQIVEPWPPMVPMSGTTS